MNDTRIGGNMFSFFRKKNQPLSSLSPADLPEDILILSLFENAILHAQNFIQRFRKDKTLSVDIQAQLASQMVEYALAIMIFYFAAAGKDDLKQKVIKKHEKFVLENCETKNKEMRKLFLDAWHREIQRKVYWLGLGNTIDDLEKNTFARNITSDEGFHVDINKYELAPYIEQFVKDVDLSMKHFGVLLKLKIGDTPAGRRNPTPTQKL